MPKTKLPQKSIGVKSLLRLLQEYDLCNGEFPEHNLEGQAVGTFLLYQLGYSPEQIKSMAGETEWYSSADVRFEREKELTEYRLEACTWRWRKE